MKYLSLDLETTGLNPLLDQILMVGAVVEDTEHPEVPVEDLPSFVCFIEHDRYRGNAFALGLNGWIFDNLSGRNRTREDVPIYPSFHACGDPYVASWVPKFSDFLSDNFSIDERIILAGKNMGSFDFQFLKEELPAAFLKRFGYRYIDPGSVFIDWSKGPESLPAIKGRFGMEEECSHDALEDARDVVRVLRKSY
jgi:oligoribonuclease (3'-5' exoribonuclease)